MKTFKVIPSIDIYNGKLVRLKQGSFNKDSIIYYEKTPLEYAKHLITEGYNHIHIVNLNSAQDGRLHYENWDEIYDIVDYAKRHNVTVDAGGGIRNIFTINHLCKRYCLAFNNYFKFNIGTMAYKNIGDLKTLINTYGPEKFVISFDYDVNSYLRINGWENYVEFDIFKEIKNLYNLGVKDFIMTCVNNDGMCMGYGDVGNFIRNNSEIKDIFDNINIIISGGCKEISDLYILKKSGFSSAIVGKALCDENFSLKDWNTLEELNPMFNMRYGAFSQKLIPAVIQDASTNKVLMLGYMNLQALSQTITKGFVTFYSREQKKLWTKGETSGNYLSVVSIMNDCDNDTLLIKVNPNGPICHKGNDTCWNEKNINNYIDFFSTLQTKIDNIRDNKIKSSGYTINLLGQEIPKDIIKKIVEEAGEVAIEGMSGNIERIVYESADLLYNLTVLLSKYNLSINDVAKELKSRDNNLWKKHN